MDGPRKAVVAVPVLLAAAVGAYCGPPAAPWLTADRDAGLEWPAISRREAELAERAGHVHRCHERKLTVLTQVIDGGLPLLDAAAAFRAIDEQNPVFLLDMFRASCPGATDDERYCRAVVRSLNWLSDDAVRPGTAARLDAELAALLARGDVRLPDASAEPYGRVSANTRRVRPKSRRRASIG